MYHCVFTGTENAADDDDRKKIAVEPETGGSYVVSLNGLVDKFG